MMEVMGFIVRMWGMVSVRDDQGHVGVLKPGKGTLWFPSLHFQYTHTHTHTYIYIYNL